MATPLLVIFLISLSLTSGKVSLYLSSDQTEALYGIKTPGLYYITEGVVNKYAMNFQHQVTSEAPSGEQQSSVIRCYQHLRVPIE